MSVQMIELEEVQTVEVSDEALETTLAFLQVMTADGCSWY